MSKTIEFYDETFTLADEVSEIALMEFAEAASDGVDGDTMEGLAAMWRLVKECVAPADLKRFRTVARKNRAGSADLVQVIEATFTEVAERPTSRPSVSSDGPVRIGRKSESSSDDKVSEALSGRPDLLLAVSRETA